MKELSDKKYIEATDYKSIAECKRCSLPYSNNTMHLYDTGREKDRYVLEVIEIVRYQYSCDDEDVSKPQEAVNKIINEWIDNDANNSVDCLLEKYSWGLIDHFDEVDKDYIGDCIIIRIGERYGCTPVGYVVNDYDKLRVFPSAKESQAYINTAKEARAYINTAKEVQEYINTASKRQHGLSSNEKSPISYHIIANPHGLLRR
jgi:hypothetical protein